ncbi:glutamate--cysteine ligase [Celerinatantimonas yamalensis]|uniref:Glutamate--cysteine ligase n=1 Tax=Celerinatantimonas yamalensis TaxID=559956 RepID=A0ABW9G994_9GAMM
MNQDYADRLDGLRQLTQPDLGNQIGRGIEREALRIQPNGLLATTPHPRQKLGSNLTHPLITTDYAENLLEFVTPVAHSHQQLMASLQDIHHYAMSKMDGELLWPMSMPCFVGNDDDIPLAEYGSSHVGVMKHLYRRGLKNRYGSTMQIIAGIHYNFSLPERFWPQWQKQLGNTQPLQDFISDQYMHLIRNFYRYGWVIPYWFGASPALCHSFVQDHPSPLAFKKVGKGSLYLPYATSLRMSDLGYTSSAQSKLQISYNSLQEYVCSVRQATQTTSDEFAKIGVKVDGEYRQLNSNILQIENELYAPIRAKRVTQSGQTPSQALYEKGIEYIEVRSLDLNPFSAQGVTTQQLQFIDTLLLWCLMMPSEPFATGELQQCRENLNQVATQGRDPQLQLTIGNKKQSVVQWRDYIMNGSTQVAELLGEEFYSALDRVRHQAPLSEQLLGQLQANDEDNGTLALELAQNHRLALQEHALSQWSTDQLDALVRESLARQQAIEAADHGSLDEYLDEYFQRAMQPLD